MSNKILLLDSHLKTLRFLIRCSGLSLESRKRNVNDKIKDRSLFVWNILWLSTDVLGGMVWFVDTGTSIVGLTRIAPCAIYSSISIVKGYFFVRHEHDIDEVIDKLRKLQMKASEGLKTKEEIRILKKETNFLALVIKMSNVLNVVLLATFALSPLILIAYQYIKTNELDLILPFLIIYPFDTKDLRYWPFAYLHQIWSECVAVLYLCISDYLFYTCCTFIRIQFRLLQYSVENVTSSDRSLDDMGKKLIELIKWHQELISLSDILEIVYTKVTLFNFLCSSVVICLTGLSVIATEDIVFRVTFLVFLSTSLLQIFLLCFFGDMLMRSSLDLVDAVYKTKWYQVNPAISKNFLLMLIRAQKPCKLTAASFAYVNLPAFGKILSTAWSYFALLNTMFSSART